MKIPTRYLDLDQGIIKGQEVVERRLSQLEGCFADAVAYQKALQQGDPLVYKVSSLEGGQGVGDLHYGLGWIAPGKVGKEYYLTRGHLHQWREAAEVYVALRGQGLMLLEDEASRVAWTEPLVEGSVVYVPGSTAHRTVNTGDQPLIYLGIYPAWAGHDYGSIAERNFGQVVMATSEGPKVMVRSQWGAIS
jgi:glucose-6-phosphate isomerase